MAQAAASWRGRVETLLTRMHLRRQAAFLRARLRQGVRRARGSFIPIVQAALGAAASWFIAHDLFGQPAPVFAPIATWVCLGFSENREPRKVAELGVGATLGVAIGELFIMGLGAGWWQLALVLFVGGLVGRLLDRGVLFTMQVGVNSMVVVGMSVIQVVGSNPGMRWLDALSGALVAFIITVLLPRHPLRRPLRYASSAMDEVAKTIDLMAGALGAGDVERLNDLQGQLSAVHRISGDWEAALRTAREVVRLNPMLRKERLDLAELDRLFQLSRRTVATLDILARQSLGFTEQVGSMPTLVSELLVDAARGADLLADAVREWRPPEEAREILRATTRRAKPAVVGDEDWRPSSLMSLVRALLVDLLQLTGLSKQEARAELPDTGGIPFAVDIEERSVDDASPLWVAEQVRRQAEDN
ncbi:FUSC family protein [Nigerium massiliense]|uniref:FUSC family protein n=1 Tax=Nigerium massiliense TaxID=1522317 RepID=UPI00059024A7|nr:FUSC family protein [Nigerium massiliense]